MVHQNCIVCWQKVVSYPKHFIYVSKPSFCVSLLASATKMKSSFVNIWAILVKMYRQFFTMIMIATKLHPYQKANNSKWQKKEEKKIPLQWKYLWQLNLKKSTRNVRNYPNILTLQYNVLQCRMNSQRHCIDF